MRKSECNSYGEERRAGECSCLYVAAARAALRHVSSSSGLGESVGLFVSKLLLLLSVPSPAMAVRGLCIHPRSRTELTDEQ